MKTVHDVFGGYIDPDLKHIEYEFKGVHLKAIQGDPRESHPHYLWYQWNP